MHTTKSTVESSNADALDRLQHSHREFTQSFSTSLQAALRESKKAVQQGEEAEVEAAKVRLEYARFRRTIEEHEVADLGKAQVA